MNVIGLPIPEQLKTCFILSASVTNLYKTISLIRVDERTGRIYFLAGEEIELLILQNGEWRFVE